MSEVRLAVWGDPIVHSKSPLLHAAAYRALDLDWEYGRRQVNAAGFGTALGELDGSWRGLSVTMPLKEQAFRAVAARDRDAELTGAVNTLLFGDVLRGFNTDVGGIIDALNENGIRSVMTARILGAGATASSALVAVSEMGARHIEVRARRPERAAAIRSLGEKLGVEVSVAAFDDSVAAVDVTIATLPGGTILDDSTVTQLGASGGALLDAAYAPWPSALASAWQSGPVISGLDMLLNQAVRQVRVFVYADPLRELDDEVRVRDEMRLAVMGD
ncbi:shikimate dehydrogenase [Microbacterium sp. CH12i]|uniref:shikimate dehydrogenase family protein n=1 Tax=Microbacterium sp. CH12i TaxID=1479651 RepID=UPI0004618DE6|nr:hypothetical protein [Microbacterium sp. CH12i]KDA05651.1 shikimate dehydrogenase [Microbacterium sp. CH12i]